MDLLPYNISLISKGKGFINGTGSSCYYNSLLQGLLSCSSMYPYIREYNGNDKFIKAFRTIWISEILNNAGARLTEKNTTKYESDYESKYHEGMQVIMSCDSMPRNETDTALKQLYATFCEQVQKELDLQVENELAEYKKNKKQHSPGIYDHKQDADLVRQLNMPSGQQDTTELFVNICEKFTKEIPNIIRLFEHRIKRTIYCGDCGKSYYIYYDETYIRVSQELKEDALNTYIIENSNISDANTACSLCTVKSAKKLTEHIVMVPEILVITFNKFLSNEANIKKKLATPFPKELFFPASKSHKYQFKLVAIINHHGASAKSGHYTANVLRLDGWWHISDASTVHLEQGPPAPSDESFVLFYHYEKIIT